MKRIYLQMVDSDSDSDSESTATPVQSSVPGPTTDPGDPGGTLTPDSSADLGFDQTLPTVFEPIIPTQSVSVPEPLPASSWALGDLQYQVYESDEEKKTDRSESDTGDEFEAARLQVPDPYDSWASSRSNSDTESDDLEAPPAPILTEDQRERSARLFGSDSEEEVELDFLPYSRSQYNGQAGLNYSSDTDTEDDRRAVTEEEDILAAAIQHEDAALYDSEGSEDEDAENQPTDQELLDRLHKHLEEQAGEKAVKMSKTEVRALFSSEIDLDNWDKWVLVENLLRMAFTEISLVQYRKSMPSPPSDQCLVGSHPVWIYIRRDDAAALKSTMSQLFSDRDFQFTLGSGGFFMRTAARISMVEFQQALRVAKIDKIRMTNYGMKASIDSYHWLEMLNRDQEDTMSADFGVYWKTPGYIIAFRQKTDRWDDKTAMYPTLDHLLMEEGLFDPTGDRTQRASISVERTFDAEESRGSPFIVKKMSLYPKLVHYIKARSTFTLVHIPMKYKGTRNKLNMWGKMLVLMEEELHQDKFCGSRIETRAKVKTLEDARTMVARIQLLVLDKFDVYKIPVQTYISVAKKTLGKIFYNNLHRGTNTKITPTAVKKSIAFMHNSMGLYNRGLELLLQRVVFNPVSKKYNWEKNWNAAEPCEIPKLNNYPVTQGQRVYEIPDSALPPDYNENTPEEDLVEEILQRVKFVKVSGGGNWGIRLSNGRLKPFPKEMTKEMIAAQIEEDYKQFYSDHVKLKN